jgi:hypothetical protein
LKLIKRYKKGIIYVFISILLLVFGLFAFGKSISEPLTDYSTYSTEINGNKALYLLTGQMGYDVKRYERPARFLPDNTVMTALNPDVNTFNDKDEQKYLEQWIAKGNIFILIADTEYMEKYDLEYLKTGKLLLQIGESDAVYSFGSGKVFILFNCNNYTNAGLKSIIPGQDFISVLDMINRKKVLFNEFYHGYGKDGLSIWDVLGPVGSLVLLQLILGLIVLMYIKSRRFGKPVIIMEIIKRQENENLFAVSNIYIKAKAEILVFENCLNDFLKDLSKFLGYSFIPGDSEIINAASTNTYLIKMNFNKTLIECREFINEGKRDTMRLTKLIKRLERIKRGIK